MDYFWYLLGYTTDTPITTTTFKNKDIMNAINKELIIFDKKKLKKSAIKKYISINIQIKNFDKKKLNKIKSEIHDVSLEESGSSIEYEFSFSSDSEQDYPVYTIEEFIYNGLILF